MEETSEGNGHDKPDPGHDWSTEHRDYWMALGAQVGATEQQARFAYAISTGHSQSSAAKFAKYAGEPRTQGYSTARTRRVQTMLTLAELDGWQNPDTFVSEQDKDKLLNGLMRSGDPQIRMKAIQLSDQRREKEIERNAVPYAFDPVATLNELSEIDPMLARWLAISHGLPWKLPAASVAAALVRLEDVRRQILSDADTAMRRPDAVADRPIEANGNAVAEPIR